jgi:hypothetical protein
VCPDGNEKRSGFAASASKPTIETSGLARVRLRFSPWERSVANPVAAPSRSPRRSPCEVKVARQASPTTVQEEASPIRVSVRARAVRHGE